MPSRFGDPHETLEQAKKAMAQRGIIVSRSSRTWLTAPVPLSDQPWYHNAVVEVSTILTPSFLLRELQAIEEDFGRVRSERNAPRILDLDLIAYNDTVLDKPDLMVPHPRMHQRAFVLRPMFEITQEWGHPVMKVYLDDLIKNLPPEQQVEPMEDLVAAG